MTLVDLPLVLGTVQLGQPYGIANTVGQPDQKLANEIVNAAIMGGITMFDTAQGYGNSEKVLGVAIKSNDCAQKVQIITKLCPSFSETDETQLESMVRSSLESLCVSQLNCLMFHREEQLHLLDSSLGRSLGDLAAKGLVRRLGISVYSTKAALAALVHPLISVVQLPASFLDRRFEHAGVFELARNQKKEIHIRSVFLQGLLCMELNKIPEYFSPLFPAIKAFQSLCFEYDTEPAGLALAFASNRWPHAKLLFGAETPLQVQKNIGLFKKQDLLPASVFNALNKLDPPQLDNLLNPSLWPN